MGVVMQIMIIPLHIDIRPALQNPFKIIADTDFAGVIEYRPVTALPQPDKRWVICDKDIVRRIICLLYTSPSPRDVEESRMPSSA